MVTPPAVADGQSLSCPRDDATQPSSRHLFSIPDQSLALLLLSQKPMDP